MNKPHGNTLVWVYDHDGPTRVRLSEARQNDWYIALCALCDNYAAKLDHLAPYHEDNNRCKKHLGR